MLPLTEFIYKIRFKQTFSGPTKQCPIFRADTQAMQSLFLFLSFALAFLAGPLRAQAKADPAKKLEKPVSALKKTHKAAVRSQKKINRLDDETRQMLERYRILIQQSESLKIYNDRLKGYIEGQKEEMIALRRQIEQVKDTGKEIEPLILRMMDSLERFVDLDIPFLLEERKQRLRKLRQILNRSDVSTGEKYRQLLSAFRRERDYGRHLQTWRALRDIGDQKLMVDYVRLGRLVFLYKSLDGREMAVYDQKTASWLPLSRSYKKDVDKAILTALKRIPPSLLKLPVPPPEKEAG